MSEDGRTCEVGAEDHRLRIDRYLGKAFPELSRKQIARLLREGLVLINGRPRGPATFVRKGDSLTLCAPVKPPGGDPRILLMTRHLAAVAKPPGYATNPTPGAGPNLLSWLEEQPETTRLAHPPGVIHRLDRDSSGVVLFSLDPVAHRLIVSAFRKERIEKRYLALIAGSIHPAEGTITTPLKRTRSGRVRAAEDGLPSRSEYRTIAGSKAASLLELRPVTGRMHQLRVHLASRGRPIAGDALYGKPSTHLGAPRLWLHSATIRLPDELASRLEVSTVLICALWDDLARHLSGIGIDYEARKM